MVFLLRQTEEVDSTTKKTASTEKGVDACPYIFRDAGLSQAMLETQREHGAEQNLISAFMYVGDFFFCDYGKHQRGDVGELKRSHTVAVWISCRGQITCSGRTAKSELASPILR